jgi:hypothetical protein
MDMPSVRIGFFAAGACAAWGAAPLFVAAVFLVAAFFAADFFLAGVFFTAGFFFSGIGMVMPGMCICAAAGAETAPSASALAAANRIVFT